MFLCIYLCLRKIICKFIGWRVWQQQKILCETRIFMVWTSLHLVKNLMKSWFKEDKERNFENIFEKDRCVVGLAEEMFCCFFFMYRQLWHFREGFTREIYSVFQRPILVLQFSIPYNWRFFCLFALVWKDWCSCKTIVLN